ncbi:MAG: lipocalin family protein [Gelidibacter sp.]
MKTLFKKISILLIVLASGMSSCSKNDDSPPPTTAELLTNKWFLVKQEDLSTTPPTVYVADACEQNGNLNFMANGALSLETFSMDVNSACVSDGVETGSYVLSANEDQLQITTGSPPGTETWDIDTLTQSELILIIGSGSGKVYLSR